MPTMHNRSRRASVPVSITGPFRPPRRTTGLIRGCLLAIAIGAGLGAVLAGWGWMP